MNEPIIGIHLYLHGIVASFRNGVGWWVHFSLYPTFQMLDPTHYVSKLFSFNPTYGCRCLCRAIWSHYSWKACLYSSVSLFSRFCCRI